MVFDIVSAVLLYSFAIPVIMYYRIWPIEGTPYLRFGLIFLLLTINILIPFISGYLKRLTIPVEGLKNILLFLVLTLVLGGTVYTAMVDRHKVAPVWGVHDVILQEEAAIRYLTQGLNPYKETYFGTPVESFGYEEPGNPDAINPALYHFVMPPWYLIFHLPFYYVSVHTLGYFDARLPLLFLMTVLLIALWYWIDDKSLARLAIIVTALSPSVVNYFVEGRSDVFALSFLMVSLVLLHKKMHALSAICLGLAAMSKQTVWFILPFIFLYEYFDKKAKKSLYQYWIIFTSVVILCMLPFLLWDAKAFLDSVIFYLSGNAAFSYPVAGYGLGMVLYQYGIITDIHTYYPFILWQIVFAVPVFMMVTTWLNSQRYQSILLFSYAIFLTVFWYMSRYFNNSHLGYIAMLFVLGAVKYLDEHHSEITFLDKK